ncbi:MAG: ABC transporter ATP-binding protein/permease [Firmicutes bacterium]|nr:ABC transporter ATP-binding protein/permease [Bacillota bacterium]
MKNLKYFISCVGYSVNLVARPHKLTAGAYIVLCFLTSVFPLVSTYVLRNLLNVLTADKIEMTLVGVYIAAYILAVVLLQAVSSMKDLSFNSLTEKGRHEFNLRIVEKLKSLPISFIDSSYGKDLIEKARMSEVSAVLLSDNIIRVVTYLAAFFVAFVPMVRFSVFFSLLFLVLTIPGIIVRAYCEGALNIYVMQNAANNRKYSYYRWMLIDRWPAKDVRMYNLTDPIEERYRTEMQTYRDKMIKLNKRRYGLTTLAEILKRSGEVVFTAYIVISAIRGNVTIGDATLYIGYSLTVISNFTIAMDLSVSAYQKSKTSLSRFFEFMDIACEDGNEAKRALGKFRSLEFVDVYFKYPHTDKYILSGASFTLERGDKLSIVGMNGSGKSTIVKLMLGLYEIDSGEILINGFPMSDYDIKDVRRMFSALFQSFVQYPLTLRDNIALSDYERAEHDEAIEDALNQSGVYGEIKDKLENGLDSYMTREFDDHGTELSRGQWQKIALSRAYFKNADILIMDEPSAALDAEAEDRIFKNFESISEGRTGIMISHRISAARLTNKIIVLDGGKITETGTHDELIAKDGLYARFYNLQKEKYTAEGAR